METVDKKLPDKPGVYIFRGEKRAILYIGKATSLKTRVQSYFRKDLMETRGPILVGMLLAAKSVDYIETDSVLEALILEAHLIKKHLPPYNTKEKDNKSFNYVIVTDEKYPRVLIMRGRELSDLSQEVTPISSKNSYKIKYSFGPFPHGGTLKEALSLVRKIFPFRDTCKPESGKLCFNAQIGLCPGVCNSKISAKEYSKTIRRIKLFFEGKKKTLLQGLETEMKTAVKKLAFEDALRFKRTIFSLQHIQDIALLKNNLDLKKYDSTTFRIEAYDAAHLSGTNTVGVMTVVEDNEAKKSDYRKFKIHTSTNDDNASLQEMISRRLKHEEWPLPNLIVVDGGQAQLNTATKKLREFNLEIPIVGVVKDEHHRPREIIGDEKMRHEHERGILLANSEAHRFAILYHRLLRRKPLKR